MAAEGGSSWFGSVSSFFKLLWEYKTLTIASLVIIVILVHNYQGMMEQPNTNAKLNYLFDHLITPLAITDIKVYQLTDEIFNPQDNVFNDFKQAPDLKNKFIEFWHILRTLESLAFYLCYFYLIFSCIYYFFDWQMAHESDSFKFFMAFLIYGLLLMIANLSLLNETTTEEHFVEHIGRVVPYRGITHLGIRLYQVFFVSAYDLFQDNFVQYNESILENLTYYNETGVELGNSLSG